MDAAIAAHVQTPHSALARRRWVGTVGAAVAGLTLVGCSDAEDVGLLNDSDEIVMVEFGSGESEELPADGGAYILDVDECRDGPILISYEGGKDVELPGPICPGEELRITADDAEISTTPAP